MRHPLMKVAEEEFRKQFDELGLKPPKNSMKGLERELIINYWRNWHINSIKEILEAEVVRKRKELLDLISYSNTPDSELYYESAKTTAENDIEHLTNIINNLK